MNESHPDSSRAVAAVAAVAAPLGRGVGQMTRGSPRPFRFGLQVGRASSASAWRDLAVQAEDAGFDVLLMPDHFGDQFSPFVGLAAAAAATSTVRLGTLVIDNDFRHPLVLAKEAATLDVISGGRLELGLGAGWDGSDYSETGIPFDEPTRRVARLEEAIAVLKGAFGGEPFSHQGRHYHVDRYRGAPPARPKSSPWRPGPSRIGAASCPLTSRSRPLSARWHGCVERPVIAWARLSSTPWSSRWR
jgi:alkanesulfonate monooxygenase SsuD/methylene tetrahydromethanopterin reductase-like flavin-dependent oxidoreductase (luciferase family)